MLTKQLTPAIESGARTRPANSQQKSQFRSWTAGLLIAGVLAGAIMLGLQAWVGQAASHSREVLTATAGSDTYTLVATESASGMVNVFSVLVIIVVSASVVTLAGMLRSGK